MIHISDSAARKIASLKLEDSRPESDLLRIQVKKGGCSGLSYKMDFTSEPIEGDQIFEGGGQKVAVDSESFMYLIGMILDYSGGLNGKGFVFNNPNANKKCGCGTSFNV